MGGLMLFTIDILSKEKLVMKSVSEFVAELFPLASKKSSQTGGYNVLNGLSSVRPTLIVRVTKSLVHP